MKKNPHSIWSCLGPFKQRRHKCVCATLTLCSVSKPYTVTPFIQRCSAFYSAIGRHAEKILPLNIFTFFGGGGGEKSNRK
jgi:hypothetical protein